MTFSIVACDLDAGEWGVAVASKFPAVGAVVPWARAGAGAVATQSWANTSFGPAALELMGAGLSAGDTLTRLLDEDEAPDQRQVGLVDAAGRASTFTGEACIGWAGGRTGEGYACQGNILEGERVIAELAETFEGADGDLLDRLLAALLAGDRAGGDRRGRQSAALLVVREGGGYGGLNDRWVDLRVDDHPEAPTELARVVEVYDRDILIRHDPLLEATPGLVADLQRRLRALGRLDSASAGELDPPTREALAGFAGDFNLEGKLRNDALLYESLLREVRDVTPDIDEP